MQKDFHIHTDGAEVVIREGQALPLKEPVALHLSGDINAPKEFYNKRKHLFNTLNAKGYSTDSSNVVIDKKNGKVTFTINESSAYACQVTGILSLNPVIAKLRINDETFQGFLPAELAKALRLMRAYFTDITYFNTLINNLQDFKAKFDTEVIHADNKKGNIANSVVKKMTSEHNYNFSLNLPIFEGTPTVTFPIEVDISYSGDSTIRCQLVSVEMLNLQDIIKEDIVKEYIELFKDFPVIIQ